MARTYKCFECKDNVLADGAISADGHYYHAHCYALVLDRKSLMAYICQLFRLKAPGPVIYSQRKTFMKKYNYTDAGMLKTLRYLYEVQKTKIDGAKERIGLIPYAYDEAQEYFIKEENQKKEIAQKMADAIINQKTEFIYIKDIRKEEPKKDFIDPASILQMDDEE